MAAAPLEHHWRFCGDSLIRTDCLLAQRVARARSHDLIEILVLVVFSGIAYFILQVVRKRRECDMNSDTARKTV